MEAARNRSIASRRPAACGGATVTTVREGAAAMERSPPPAPPRRDLRHPTLDSLTRHGVSVRRQHDDADELSVHDGAEVRSRCFLTRTQSPITAPCT